MKIFNPYYWRKWRCAVTGHEPDPKLEHGFCNDSNTKFTFCKNCNVKYRKINGKWKQIDSRF